MTRRRLVDTNLIVRHLTQDHPEHSRAADALFRACDDGVLKLIILPVVLAECIFVLESFYKHSREQISAALRVLISSGGIELADTSVLPGRAQSVRDEQCAFHRLCDRFLCGDAQAGDHHV